MDMKLIYKNEYGCCFKVNDCASSMYQLQLVVDSVGMFMSMTDLNNLLRIVTKPGEVCNCEECQNSPYKKIWCSNPLVDICLKVDEVTLGQVEDLILGTKFMLEVETTLNENSIN